MHKTKPYPDCTQTLSLKSKWLFKGPDFHPHVGGKSPQCDSINRFPDNVIETSKHTHCPVLDCCGNWSHQCPKMGQEQDQTIIDITGLLSKHFLFHLSCLAERKSRGRTFFYCLLPCPCSHFTPLGVGGGTPLLSPLQ